MRSDRDRLIDILDATEKIEERIPADKAEFAQNELLQVWALHYLQIIGEAANKISDEFKQSHNEVPWGEIIGMRHILVHGYFEIDLDIVWVAIKDHLPVLKEKVKKILH